MGEYQSSTNFAKTSNVDSIGTYLARFSSLNLILEITIRCTNFTPRKLSKFESQRNCPTNTVRCVFHPLFPSAHSISFQQVHSHPSTESALVCLPVGFVSTVNGILNGLHCLRRLLRILFLCRFSVIYPRADLFRFAFRPSFTQKSEPIS